MDEGFPGGPPEASEAVLGPPISPKLGWEEKRNPASASTCSGGAGPAHFTMEEKKVQEGSFLDACQGLGALSGSYSSLIWSRGTSGSCRDLVKLSGLVRICLPSPQAVHCL